VKLCLRHWGIVILSSRVGLGEKPLRESCSPVVRHRVARAGQGDDDLVVQHFDVKSWRSCLRLQQKGADRSRRPPMLDIEIPVLTYSTVTVTSLRHWFPRGTGEAPRRPPVRGFSMRDVHSKQSSKMGEGSRGFLCDLW
jgi:hypothetical protein